MTNLEALIGEVEPYTVSPFSLKKKLADNGVSDTETYSVGNKRSIAMCAVSILVSLLPLSGDSTGKSSQSYNREGLERRIHALCSENGLDLPDSLAVPTVEIYPDIF